MGTLMLGRADDGTLKVIRADDEIEVDGEVYDDISREPGPYWLDGDVLRIEASGESLAYVLTDFDRLTNTWRAVRTKDDGTPR